MAKQPLTIAAVTAVVVGLAFPAVVAGQAIPRTASTGGGTVSTGSSGSSGSSSGGSTSSGSTSSGSSSSGSSSAGPGLPAPSRGHSGDSSDGPGVIASRGRASVVPPAPGGRATAAVSAPPVNASAERRTGVGIDDGSQGFSSSLSRPRGDNPISGFAAPRTIPDFPIGGGGGGDNVGFPFWGPWGPYYPWYGGGFGYGFGYYGYSPWYYGATCWGWGRWGAWYDPFGYCWNPYFGAPTAYVEIAGTGGNSYRKEKVEPATGKLRIITSPKTASVYIDDALAGTVDEFDGLSDHLELDKGRHVLSVRAEGYEAAVQDVVIEGGKTVTVRLSLKKVK